MCEGKTSGLKTFRELARPLTSAYVCLRGHRERAHPAPSAAINGYFQHLLYFFQSYWSLVPSFICQLISIKRRNEHTWVRTHGRKPSEGGWFGMQREGGRNSFVVCPYLEGFPRAEEVGKDHRIAYINPLSPRRWHG